MSTGLECDILNVKGLGWFYILQAHDCPVSAWDWHEHSPHADGPFPDEEAAFGALRRHHANPGGYSTHEMHLLQVLASPTLRDIIEHATLRKLDRPVAPAEGTELAADLVSLGGTLKPGMGWISQVSHEDGHIDIRTRQDRQSEEGPSIRVSVTWYPDRLHARICRQPETDGKITSFISKEIMREAERILPGVPVEVEEIMAEPEG